MEQINKRRSCKTAYDSAALKSLLYTSVKIIKNEVRCRDDTVPKTVDTRKHCKVGLRACNNLPQPRKTKM